MNPTVNLEIPASSEVLIRQVLALQDEMNALALSAPDATVLDACEEAVIPKGRDLVLRVLSDAVARRVESAEKRGRRSAPARADVPGKTGAKPPASTSRPAAS